MKGKTDIQALRRTLETGSGPEYWRSLDELAATSDFVDSLHREFAEGVSEWNDAKGRRRFLKLMGSSLALAGVQGCISGPPQEEIVPYVQDPENVVPGRPQFYATAFPFRGFGQGVLVESHAGRPTKIEGNPDHPASLGATNVFAQASILDLYDRRRSTTPRLRGEQASWDLFISDLRLRLQRFRENGGRGLRLLTETTTSPTLGGQIDALLARYPEARWHRFDAVSGQLAEEGLAKIFGRPVVPVYDISRAHTILSIDADFMFALPGSVRYARDWSERRRVRQGIAEINRMYAVESTVTITGAMADHRLPLKPSTVERVVRALAMRMGVGEGPQSVPDVDDSWLDAVVDDLLGTSGSALVIAGEVLHPESHVLVHRMNERLNAVGETLTYKESVDRRPAGGFEPLQALAADMEAEEVDTLVMLGGNPVYAAPADVAFERALLQVPFSIHLSMHADETSLRTTWHLPRTHYLETWGDVRAFDGTPSIIQPLIAPLYEACRSDHEMVAVLMDQWGSTGYDLVRSYWRDRIPGGDFERSWQEALRAGIIRDAGSADVTVPSSLDFEALQEQRAVQEHDIELVFRPDPAIWDGAFATNGWLQELPKPITKLSWDNAALISPDLAERLGIEPEQMIRMGLRGRSMEAAVWIVPGHPDDTITLTLGYGRRTAGANSAPRGASDPMPASGGRKTGNGFNAYLLRTTNAEWNGVGVTIEPLSERYHLVSTQHHHSMEGRPLVEEADIERFRKNPGFIHEEDHELHSLYPEFEYTGYKWGMVIDINTCIGCNACIVACQAENNIPIVGKDEVGRGREMHWLRVDRYYKGALSNPKIFFQPVPCMHCEKAPCEVVCPVYATVHDSEGLNVMVYNRCIGTRYCSNNCPYKVRRFNFLQYADWDSNIRALQRNPDVTVRSRGVMEKCTYCQQRINHARVWAKKENRAIRDGEVMTACQTACPTGAITFGDLNDETAHVYHLHQEPHNYDLLRDLGTHPRTTYLAHFRNPNGQVPERGMENRG